MNSNGFDILHPDRVLFIVAHPDDPDFGAGGTTARWVRNGTKVVYVIVTDGSKGSNDPEISPERLQAIRQAEQRAAAQVLGVSEVVFLGYPDGEVYNTPQLRRDLVRQIRLFRPDVVVTHDRAVGDTALDAVFPLARDRLNFPEHAREGLEPHRVLNILLQSTGQPNEWVDIEPTLDLKIAALREHRSQIGDPEDLAKRIREGAHERADGTPYTYAEHFRRITLRR
jgi:LmbE family N-acetylglucosaminyl deacetylase